jgi:hypothetical protein
MKYQTWDKVRVGTKVVLARDTRIASFGGGKVLKAGKYKINGFWANVCSLSNGVDIDNFVMQSEDLKRFEGII